jgi:hypothetical protein
VPKKLSATAFSNASPILPIDLDSDEENPPSDRSGSGQYDARDSETRLWQCSKSRIGMRRWHRRRSDVERLRLSPPEDKNPPPAFTITAGSVRAVLTARCVWVTAQ